MGCSRCACGGGRRGATSDEVEERTFVATEGGHVRSYRLGRVNPVIWKGDVVGCKKKAL
jgi:hypothetical protein